MSVPSFIRETVIMMSVHTKSGFYFRRDDHPVLHAAHTMDDSLDGKLEKATSTNEFQAVDAFLNTLYMYIKDTNEAMSFKSASV
jgi:hypothetical protein